MEANNKEIRLQFESVIVDIYNKYHKSPYSDIKKHNEGIAKAMAEFAIFYHKQQLKNKHT